MSNFAGSPVGWKIETTCTSVGADSVLTPKGQDAGAATTITFAGNTRFVVGRDYIIRVDSK